MSDIDGLPKIKLDLEYADIVKDDLDEIEIFLTAKASTAVAEEVVEEIMCRCEDLPGMPCASNQGTK